MNTNPTLETRTMNYVLPPFASDGEFVEGMIEVSIETKTGVFLDSIFDPEAETPTQADFDPVFSTAEAFFAKFDSVFEKDLLEIIAAEITDESYEDSHLEPREEDYEVLQKDLILKSAQFFSGATMLIYESPRVFPKDEIVVQLNAELEVDEVYIEE